MSRRLFVLLALILLLPMVGLTWVGMRVAADRQAVAADQFRTLTRDRLRDLSASVSQNLTAHERQFERQLSVDHPDALRRLRRSEPLFSQVFLLDREGNVLFPPRDKSQSKEEAAFLLRTDAIWKRQAILYSPPAKEQPQSAQTRERQPSRRSGRGDSMSDLAQRSSRGWIAWHWKEGLHLLFWRRLPDGRIAGAEIERVVLLSRIVGALPSGDLEDGRILLADSRGDAVYQWGPLEPSPKAEPVAEELLAHPLDSWRLAYFASEDQRQLFLEGGSSETTYLSLGAVLLALLILGLFFYRELNREMADAAQRVNFVTQVSHELKTPLANIRLYAELLESELEDEALEARSQVIVAESERLTRLINNILTFAKQRRGQLLVESTSLSLDPLVERVLGHFGPALRTHQIEVSFEGGAPKPVRADADAVEQVLANLINNVEKYAAAGGRLDIMTVQEGARTKLIVSDAGPGIPDRHRDRIFHPFHRVSDRLTDGVTGTGIGLSIARDLARRCGGELRLERSEQGACFVLELNTMGEET